MATPVKVQDALPIVPPGGEPTPEFIQVMNEIKQRSAGLPVIQTPGTTTVAEPLAPLAPSAEVKHLPQPVTLTYKYEGEHDCGNKVSTFELDADGKHFVICYCLICQKQVESREVANLKSEKIEYTGDMIDIVKDLKKAKKGKK